MRKSREPARRKNPEEWEKLPCEICAHYEDCPRMRGENICYGLRKKKQIHDLGTQPPQDTFAQLLGDLHGGRVLDVGTALGGFIHILIKAFAGYTKIIGIDIDAEAIAAGQKDFQQENVRLLQMNATQMEFEDDSFDLVNCCVSLHHLPHIDSVLVEMKRVLKPGGYCVVSEMYHDRTPGIDETLFQQQRTEIMMHHWSSAIDRARGVPHNETLTSQEIIRCVSKPGWKKLTLYRAKPLDPAPKEESFLKCCERVIDERLAQAKALPDYETFKQHGKETRRRLYEIGVQRSPWIIVVAQK